MNKFLIDKLGFEAISTRNRRPKNEPIDYSLTYEVGDTRTTSNVKFQIERCFEVRISATSKYWLPDTTIKDKTQTELNNLLTDGLSRHLFTDLARQLSSLAYSIKSGQIDSDEASKSINELVRWLI